MSPGERKLIDYWRRNDWPHDAKSAAAAKAEVQAIRLEMLAEIELQRIVRENRVAASEVRLIAVSGRAAGEKVERIKAVLKRIDAASPQ